jgi:hypothetical protein
MALQATSEITHNYGTYKNPYFRLVPHIAEDGSSIPVDCYMYPSKEAFDEGHAYITCLPFYIPNSGEATNNSAQGLVNKYLLYVTEEVMLKLQEMYTESSFEITEIPLENTPDN